MNEHITAELIENTYLFCVKRVSDSEAAKDLAQDILYEALRAGADGKEFVSFYSWYWRMAHNKYADYLTHKKNPALPLDTAVGLPSDAVQPIDALIEREELSALNYALSRLTAVYREIMIRFYLREQPVSRIAAELNIPVGTVKSRLFEARKSLKKGFDSMKNFGTSSYAPAQVDWFGGYSCINASMLMSSTKICPQVMVLCRGEGKTVNEIADEMGIAPLYLEEILEKMTAEKLLVPPVKGKYAANHCVFPQQAYVEAQVYANEILFREDFPKKITDRLLALKDKITSLGFYGSDLPYDYLMWVLYPIAGYVFGRFGRKRYLEKYEGKISDEAERSYRMTVQYVPPEESLNPSVYEKLRTVHWSNLTNNFHTAEYGRLAFLNEFECEPFPTDRDYWIDGNNISLLLDLAKNPKKKLTVHEEEKAARFLENGILQKENDGLRVQLPIMGLERGYNAIWALIRGEIEGYAREYADLVGAGLEERLLPYVRKDLMSNFIYWDMHCFFQNTSGLFWYGWSEALALPEDYGKSAAGLSIWIEDQ